MTKKKSDADAVIACVTDEISSSLDFYFAQIDPSNKVSAQRLAERVVKAAVFVALKARLDPEIILRRELASIHLTDQAMSGPGEFAPRIPRIPVPMSEAEIDQLAAPLREAVRQLALSGVPGVQAAGVLLTFAAQILMQESEGDFRATSLAISSFAAAVDKGLSIRAN
jgi:hypothetical protein